MRYQVFLWRRIRSKKPDVIQAVEAVSCEQALQMVMRAHQVFYVASAAVAHHDDLGKGEDFYTYRLPVSRLGR